MNIQEQIRTKKDQHEGVNSMGKISALEKALELRIKSENRDSQQTQQIKARLEKLYQQETSQIEKTPETKETPEQTTIAVINQNFEEFFESNAKRDAFLRQIGAKVDSKDPNILAQNFITHLISQKVATFEKQNGIAYYTIFAEAIENNPRLKLYFPTIRELVCHRETEAERQKPYLDAKDYRPTQERLVFTSVAYPASLEENSLEVETEVNNNIVKVPSTETPTKPQEIISEIRKNQTLNVEAEIKIKSNQTEVEVITNKETQIQTEVRKSRTLEIESPTPASVQAEQTISQKANSNREIKTISARLNRLLKSNQKPNLYLKLEKLKQNPSLTQINTETPLTFNLNRNNSEFTPSLDFKPNTNQTEPFLIPAPIFKPAYTEVSKSNNSEYSTIPSFSRYQGFKNTNLDIPDQNQFSTISKQSFLPEIRSSPEVTDDFQVNPFNFQNLGKIEFAPSQALVQPSQLESQQVDSQPDLSLNFSDFQGINFEPPKEIPQTISSSEISKLNEFDSIPVTQFQPPIFENSYKPNLGFLNQPNTETFQENNPFNQFNYQPTQAFQPKAEPYFEPRFESNFSNPQTELFPQSSNPSLEPKARLDSLKSSSKTQPEPILSETQAIESAAKSEPIEPKIQDDFVNPTSEISQTKTEPTIEANKITKFARKETQTATDETSNSLKTHSESSKIESSPANNIVKFARRESLSASIETKTASEVNSNSSNTNSQPAAQQTTPEMVMA